ncbi:hypothetical protein AAC387_Pa09g1580 [Persea americana]
MGKQVGGERHVFFLAVDSDQDQAQREIKLLLSAWFGHSLHATSALVSEPFGLGDEIFFTFDGGFYTSSFNHLFSTVTHAGHHP